MTRNWSAEENAELFRLKAAKYPVDVIASKIGRTYNAVVERWRWIHKSEEKRQRRRDQINLTRRRNGEKPYVPSAGHGGYAVRANRPNDTLIAEARKRLYAPRTISQELFGDPAPGYSALDRKRQGIMA